MHLTAVPALQRPSSRFALGLVIKTAGSHSAVQRGSVGTFDGNSEGRQSNLVSITTGASREREDQPRARDERPCSSKLRPCVVRPASGEAHRMLENAAFSEENVVVRASPGRTSAMQPGAPAGRRPAGGGNATGASRARAERGIGGLRRIVTRMEARPRSSSRRTVRPVPKRKSPCQLDVDPVFRTFWRRGLAIARPSARTVPLDQLP